HLLLVTAAEVAHERIGVGRSDVEGLDIARREFVLPLLRDATEPAAICLQSEHDVVPNAEVIDDALSATILGGVRDATPERGPRGAQPRCLACDAQFAGVGVVGAGEQPGEFGSPRAE